MSERSVYLHDIPLEEAQARLRAALEAAGLWGTLAAEEVPLESALGRVTIEPVWASLSSPNFHSAAMDGYALRAESSANASPTQPVELRLGSQAEYVDTGDPLPAWADAVVPIEATQPVRDADGRVRAVEMRAALALWTNVRAMGEDIVASELVLAAGQRLRPVDLGAIASAGHARVRVARRPRVVVIPTGDELVPPGTLPQRGQIVEFNSLMLAAQVEEWGGAPARFPIVKDDLDAIRAALEAAAREADLVLVNAGSSAGSEDYSAQAIAALGRVLVHGVAVRPGHPVILGMIRSGPGAREVPVIGVPGFPASAALTGEIFVRPLLERWLGLPPFAPEEVEAVLTRKVHSPLGDDEYVRVSVGEVRGKMVAAPLARGAGVLTSLVRADGIVRIPRMTQGVQAGELVRVLLYRPQAEVRRSILHIGSHDLTLDLLSQHLGAYGVRLVSANAGSVGGLVALRRGEAHLAGCHLLDPATGEYNLRYVREYLPGQAVVLVSLVGRAQGLMVARGNPKHIASLADLAREEVRFVNRQRGAGTRLLLDYHLERLGIEAARVRGYEREVVTHLAVAVDVASGVADCGLGIAAAAQALELDFVPVADERYDLVIPAEEWEGARLVPLRAVLTDTRFREAVGALPGYDVRRMGEVVTRVE
ncbi:MAG: molybdopterin biosynthesis protein [Chloroflexi bacterium]|nr:molybdopterin biosynthesis protein [Chloroflexota bacterium]